MTRKLFVQAIFKFLAGVALLFLLIFLPAGTLDYWNAWLLIRKVKYKVIPFLW